MGKLIDAETGEVISQDTDRIAELESEIRVTWNRGKAHVEQAFECQLAVGRLLSEAREHFTWDRDYGRWVASRQFGFKSAWAAVLRGAAEREQEVREIASSQLEGKSQTVNIERALRVLRDSDATKKREELERENPRPDTLNIDIRDGDFRDVLADIDPIDAIITDPPYPAKYLDLLDDLATFADKKLSDDGVLAVMFGQTHLPEVYRRLSGGRPYRWTICYLTSGNGYVSHPRRCQSNWKPVIVYGGGPRFGDIVQSAGDTGKEHHVWGQDYDGFVQLVERLTLPGQTVCDPFMGSGTTLLAAADTGRHVIGCDIDPDHVATTRSRFRL